MLRAIAPAVRLVRGRAPFVLFFFALTTVAWLVLWLWSASPYARYVTHGGWGDMAGLASLCASLPAGGLWVPATLYAAGWLLMVAAMMLPTTLPVADIVRRMSAGHRWRALFLALLIAGYGAAWLAFGLLAHAADALVQWWVAQEPWFAFNGWVAGAAILGLAGAFQFSRLKYRCLERCHAPRVFVLERWHGRRRGFDALRIGWDHGLFCVGCCWALMMLMFVVGTASLGWMLALAAVMAAEKNLPAGRRLRTPIGMALLVAAAVVALGGMGVV